MPKRNERGDRKYIIYSALPKFPNIHSIVVVWCPVQARVTSFIDYRSSLFALGDVMTSLITIFLASLLHVVANDQ